MDIVNNGFNAVKRSPLPNFWKLTALTVKDIHSPTIRCPLNVNALMIFCPAMSVGIQESIMDGSRLYRMDLSIILHCMAVHFSNQYRFDLFLTSVKNELLNCEK